MLILTPGIDSPILVYYVLLTFNYLEEERHQTFPIKNNIDARVNVNQKPYGATLKNLSVTFNLAIFS